MIEAPSSGIRPTALGITTIRVAPSWSGGAGTGIVVLLDGAVSLIVTLLTTYETDYLRNWDVTNWVLGTTPAGLGPPLGRAGKLGRWLLCSKDMGLG